MRILSVLAAVTTVLVLSACGSPDSTPSASPSTTPTPAATTTTAVPDTFSPDEVAEARTTMTAWLEAFSNVDAEAACDLMSADFAIEYIEQMAAAEGVDPGRGCVEGITAVATSYRDSDRLLNAYPLEDVAQSPGQLDEGLVEFALDFGDGSGTTFGVEQTGDDWKLVSAIDRASE